MDNNNKVIAQNLLKHLRSARIKIDEHEKAMREIEDKWKQSNAYAEYLEHKEAVNLYKEREIDAREGLLSLQLESETTLHPAIKSVRTDRKFNFETKKAVEWCKVNAPILLTVGKEFTDFLKKNDVPDFVTVEENKTIVIASDLSKFGDLEND